MRGKLEQAKQTSFNLKDMGMSDGSIGEAIKVGDSVIREWFGEKLRIWFWMNTSIGTAPDTDALAKWFP